MKNYLILLLTLLTFFSCGHELTTLSEQEMKEKEYEASFVKVFGEISRFQTWGFASAAETRTAQPNSNQWGTHDDNDKYLDWPRPADITPQERAKVLAVFNEVGEEHYDALFDTDKFFVQQVYCGPEGNKMTQLAAYDKDGHRQMVYGDPNNNYMPYEIYSYEDEVNNFNNGKYSGNAEQGCMLMWFSSTLDWSYKSTQGGGERFHYFRMEEIDGNYYVGFDFASRRQAPANANEQFDRDFIYNDWIVKVVPGKGFTPPTRTVKEEGLIICEDLGNVGDFDFNDVVFYAKVWSDGKTEITLLAAGGKLDISVDGVDVGEKMGKMVNTNGKDVEPYYFVSENTYNALIEIPIVVSKKNNAGVVTSYELTAQMGKAPQKICVPLGFKWCKEYKSLADAYPGFKDWTSGKSSTWVDGGYVEALVMDLND